MDDVSKRLAINACIMQYKTSVYEADFRYRVLFDERWLARRAFNRPQN